jgi:hypothetical protein
MHMAMVRCWLISQLLPAVSLSHVWLISWSNWLSLILVAAHEVLYAINRFGSNACCCAFVRPGIPGAWGITSSESQETIEVWLDALIELIHKHNPDWRPSCFVVDCCDALINALR